jgi:hypothetical protein
MADVYPKMWHHQDSLAYLCAWCDRLVAFFAQASADQDGMIISLT